MVNFGAGACGQGRNNDRADRICGRQRSGQGWSCRQSKSARRQSHRRELARQRDRHEATGVTTLVRTQGHHDCDVHVFQNIPDSEAERKDVQAAAQAFGLQLIMIDVSSDHDIEAAFATFAQRRADALYVGTGAFLTSKRESIVALAARYAIPTSYQVREAAVAGGLLSYGPSQGEAYRQAGIYAGRIPKGEKPADLPVMQSSKFELVINLKTAKALGLTVPMIMQMTADDVIE